MVFHLLRLPSLALIKVIKNMDMDPLGILHFMQLSMKTRSYVKYSKLECSLKIRNTTSLDFILNLEKSLCLSIEKIEPSEDIPMGTEVWKLTEKHAIFRLVTINHVKRVVLFADGDDDVRTIIDFFAGIFNVKWVSFDNEQGKTKASCQALDHILNHYKLRVQSLEWKSRCSSDRVVHKVLKAAIKVSEFEFHSMDEKRKFQFNQFHKYTLDRLLIIGSHWITVDNLCELLNCVDVSLHYANFTGDDIGILLEYWMKNGGRMEKCYIYSEEINEFEMRRVMENMNSEAIGRNQWSIEKPDGSRLLVTYSDHSVNLNVNREALIIPLLPFLD